MKGIKINIKKILYTFLILNSTFSIIFASEIHPNAGTTSASFLKIGIGARPVSMGESFVAVADDANAIYWNPAGLAQIKNNEITATHNEWFQNIKYDFIGFIFHFGNNKGTGGISFAGLYLSNLEERYWTLENPEDEPSTPSGSFGAGSYFACFSYSNFIKNLIYGINLKLIHENIDKYYATTFAIDLGILYPYSDVLTFGANLQNIGPGLTFIKKAYPLPLNIKLGASYHITSYNILFALDLNQPIDDYLHINFGIEYCFMNMFEIRTGYRYKWFGNDLGPLSGVTAGVGIKLKQLFKDMDIKLDYAFVPYGDLGFTHRISLLIKFGNLGK
jgi:hypothetical protein